MNCEDCQKAESRILDGELPPDRLSEMFRHAASCPECRRFFGSLVRLNNALTRMPPLLPTLDATQLTTFPGTELASSQRIWQRRFSLGVPVFALTVVMVAAVAVLSFSQIRKPVPVYVTQLPTLIVSPDSTMVAPVQPLH